MSMVMEVPWDGQFSPPATRETQTHMRSAVLRWRSL